MTITECTLRVRIADLQRAIAAVTKPRMSREWKGFRTKVAPASS